MSGDEADLAMHKGGPTAVQSKISMKTLIFLFLTKLTTKKDDLSNKYLRENPGKITVIDVTHENLTEIFGSQLFNASNVNLLTNLNAAVETRNQ